MSQEDRGALEEILAGPPFGRGRRGNRVMMTLAMALSVGVTVSILYSIRADADSAEHWVNQEAQGRPLTPSIPQGYTHVWTAPLALILVSMFIMVLISLHIHVGKLERALVALHQSRPAPPEDPVPPSI